MSMKTINKHLAIFFEHISEFPIAYDNEGERIDLDFAETDLDRKAYVKKIAKKYGTKQEYWLFEDESSEPDFMLRPVADGKDYIALSLKDNFRFDKAFQGSLLQCIKHIKEEVSK